MAWKLICKVLTQLSGLLIVTGRMGPDNEANLHFSQRPLAPTKSPPTVEPAQIYIDFAYSGTPIGNITVNELEDVSTWKDQSLVKYLWTQDAPPWIPPPEKPGNFSVSRRNAASYALFNRLFADHSIRRLVKPISLITNATLTVKLGLVFIQMIDIDELNQAMTTNVWLWQQWQDHHMIWDPSKYDGIRVLFIPAHMVWIPDIVLYNSADGLYAIPPCLRAKLHFNGVIQWEPPVIYKSFCQIDITWFPFDRQNCSMKFGSWTYDGLNVNLVHVRQRDSEGDVQIISEAENAVDFSNFRENTEWTVTGASAQRTIFKYSCCPETYVDVTFYIVVDRKPLFYTVNLVFPCFIISFLSIFAFYLPSQSGEKMSLSVSVLVALIMFFLVVFEKIPATSLSMPLMAKFLLFTMFLVTLSIILNVAIIRVHLMYLQYNSMPQWVKKFFIEFLATRILEQDPNGPFGHHIKQREKADTWSLGHVGMRFGEYSTNLAKPKPPPPPPSQPPLLMKRSGSSGSVTSSSSTPSDSKLSYFAAVVLPACSVQRNLLWQPLPHVLSEAERELVHDFAGSAIKISKLIEAKDKAARGQAEWSVVAIVIDVIFFYIFLFSFIIGSCLIFWQGIASVIAPSNPLASPSQ